MQDAFVFLSYLLLLTNSVAGSADRVTLRVRLRRDGDPVPGSALPSAGQELDPDGLHVGRHGRRGAGVGHRLAADPGLGTLRQWCLVAPAPPASAPAASGAAQASGWT
uniref:Uncharacterized protein n=1 Tax=Macaca fascicularis TaxID=9541 RepID=Q9BE66_MACFA|nr:hypothetical protein [Macaca fascicularis]